MGEISVKGAVEKGVVKAESKGLRMKSMEGINWFYLEHNPKITDL